MEDRTVKINRHVYVWKTTAQNLAEVTPEPSDFMLHGDDQMASEHWIPLCNVEIEVEIPAADQIELMSLAGAEAELERYRAECSKRLATMEQRVQELRCITHQPEGNDNDQA